MAKCSRCGRLLGEPGMLSPDGSKARLCGRCFQMELAISIMDQTPPAAKKEDLTPKYDIEGHLVVNKPKRNNELDNLMA